jgi:hypothetical protein
MRPPCPHEGRGIGLSWLRSSQISSSNRAGPADRETAIILAPRCGQFPWTLNQKDLPSTAGSNAGLGKVDVYVR